MVKRLQADNLKLRTEAAKKKISDQKKFEQELKRKDHEIKERLKILWESQSAKIINAAIESETRVELDLPVIYYKELIRKGIDIVEEGLISGELMVKVWKKAYADDLAKLKEEVLAEFHDFIDGSKADLKIYYGNTQKLHVCNYRCLVRAMKIDDCWGNSFTGDGIYLNDVPLNLKEKYQHYLNDINKKISKYILFIKNSELQDERDEADLRFNLDRSEAEYTYDLDDHEYAELEPCEEGNRIFADWSVASGQICLYEPILSNSGLRWISSRGGQSLLQSINNSIENSTDLGLEKCLLKFIKKNNDWYFEYNGEDVPSCSPEDVVTLIRQDGLKISVKPTKNSCTLTVEW